MNKTLGFIGVVVLCVISGGILLYNKLDTKDISDIASGVANAGNNVVDDDDESIRGSSFFNFDPDLGRGSSLSKNPLEDLKQDEAFNKESPGYGHTKVRGGKRSKKNKRKGKGKSKRKGRYEKKNKYRTLKKV